jgi:hypothetical protein
MSPLLSPASSLMRSERVSGNQGRPLSVRARNNDAARAATATPDTPMTRNFLIATILRDSRKFNPGSMLREMGRDNTPNGSLSELTLVLLLKKKVAGLSPGHKINLRQCL